MSFSFGFSGDDIENGPDDAPVANENVGNTDGEENGPPPVRAQSHDIGELLSTLPDKISYSIIGMTSPRGFKSYLPRRELFDVRMQMMAEDDDDTTNQHAGQERIAALDDSDIKTNIYEGGFKSWECSVDLVKFLMDRGPRKDLDDLWRVGHVIEMGCGTSLPTLLVFQHALTSSIPLNITLTDYNASVLRLVTLPNLLLTFAATLPATSAPFTEESPNPLADLEEKAAAGDDGQEGLHGDLEITPDLIKAFKQKLSEVPISLTLVSGSWLPVDKLLELVPSTPDMNTFILASETIYSPSSLVSFTEAMVALLKRVKSGKALVAAKRVYFGVGGSVDEFRIECSKRGAVAYEAEFEGLEEGGVRRSILEVQMC
ncbi:hypothetical protein GQ43DRAFT_380121 [Delitschia confertaspora ATCC 74209]|uniref:protein-histidine N-methyltransferase n=1 Tax=Delitschia confertaspora ATCC 74209 TaxID=1513339 RepID=A0A9P4JJT8_9PLEO|nr:hypothetical protein GQ43DRAFT_380121 [Delitschia confertaspora ATCC 74209]